MALNQVYMERKERTSQQQRPVNRLLMMVFAQLVEQGFGSSLNPGADDQRFLRRLVAFGRQHLIASMSPSEPRTKGVYRSTLECSIPDTPVVSCRLYARPMLNWQHVFRSLFPKLHALKAEAEEDRPTTRGVFYCSRLTYTN